MSDTYISDQININDFKITEFNIIASGCGTGKSHFISHSLLKHYTKIKPSEVIFLTSRSMTVDQQAKNGISKLNIESSLPIQYWHGEINDDDIDLESFGIKLMTYDKLIEILDKKNNEDYESLNRIKIVVFDECHTLFSDGFITNIELIKVWIREEIYREKKIFLGLTATPGILKFYQNIWGVKVNQVNDKVLVNYKVKQLHCTNFATIPYLISTNRLPGKTLIMCYSVSDCLKLQAKLSNAAVLVSKNNKHYTKDMEAIRSAIIKNETLPDTFEYPLEWGFDGKPRKTETRQLNVLITTSTLREGINLRKESGINNVVCCFTDELHVIQFVGRCRFDVDNLVVADTYIRADNHNKDSYLAQCRKTFKEYLDNKHNSKWFNDLAHIIEHDCYGTKKFILGSEEERFIDYINSKWLCPIGVKELNKYKIYRDEDKNEIVNMATDCKLFILPARLITFNKVVGLLKNSLGYDIGTGRIVVENQRYTYKIILAFDEEKISYKPSVATINE